MTETETETLTETETPTVTETETPTVTETETPTVTEAPTSAEGNTFGLPAETVALLVANFGSVEEYLRKRNLGYV